MFMSASTAVDLLAVVTVIVSLLHTSDATADCDRQFSSLLQKSGTFSSPNYPAHYPSDVTCRYSFQGQGNERVQLTVTDFSLDYGGDDPDDPYDCEGEDSLTVSSAFDGMSRDIGVYCGNKLPPMLMSAGSSLHVTFTTRNSPSSRGFTANYSFVTDFGIKTGEQVDSNACEFLYRAEETTNGTFTSPNFPGLYPRNTECHYRFYGGVVDRVYITFSYLDVEGMPPSCSDETQSDYVTLSNFNVNLVDRKFGRYCGERQNVGTVSSDGNFFRVTFKSNDLYDATGFEAFYQFRQHEYGLFGVDRDRKRSFYP